MSDVPVRRRDGGYVLALTALLMIPLTAFVGLAVDLGSWYARAAAIQSASDAAALAGVTYLPDLGLAQQAATQVAAQNGFVDGEDGISITIEEDGAARLRVTITDEDVPQFFTGLFTDDVQVIRGATAEYILPVAMGSPRNYIGTGQLFSGNYRDNVWAAVNGPCASRESGDQISAVRYANYQGAGGSFLCQQGPAIPTPTYSEEGFFYGIRIPETYTGGALTVKVYDAAHCSSSGSQPDGQSFASAFATQFRLLDSDSSPWNPTNNDTVLAGRVFTSGSNCGTSNACTASGSWRLRWCALGVIPTPVAGETYFVQVRTSGWPDGDAYITATGEDRVNGYSLAASTTSGNDFPQAQACSTYDNDSIPVSANCVQVYAHDRLSVFASFGSATPRFYLAELGPEHSGKDLEVQLFDIGEGTTALELLDPNGDPVEFDWQVVDEGSDTAPTGGWTGVADELNVLGTPGAGGEYCYGNNPQAGAGRVSRSKYNDRTVTLRITLPDDISAAYGDNTWWWVRYTTCSGGASSDRTTWTVRVLGDPVRLVR